MSVRLTGLRCSTCGATLAVRASDDPLVTAKEMRAFYAEHSAHGTPELMDGERIIGLVLVKS